MEIRIIDSLLIKRPVLKKALLLFGDNILILAAVYCTLGAVTSAFSISVNPGALLGIWLLYSILISSMIMIYRAKSLPILFFIALISLILTMTKSMEGARLVVYELTSRFNLWLGMPVFFPEAAMTETDPTVFIASVGVVLILLLTFAICLRRSTFFTILLTSPMVFITFVVQDYSPDVVYLIGLVVVYLTVLLSSACSPDNYEHRGLLVVPALAVAAALMLVASLIIPYEGYVRDSNVVAFANHIRISASQRGAWGHLWIGRFPTAQISGWLQMQAGGIWQFNTDNINIAESGGIAFTDQSLLEITATAPGTFYIRGYAMQHFDGRSWSAVDADNRIDDTAARGMPAQIARFFNATHSPQNQENAVPQVGININRTGDITNVDYEPYFSSANLSANLDAEAHNDVFAYDENFFYIQDSVSLIFNQIRDTAVIYTHPITTGTVIYSGAGEFLAFDALAEIHTYFESGDIGDGGFSATGYIVIDSSDYATVYDVEIVNYRNELIDYNEKLLNSGIYTQIDEHTAQALRQLAIEAGIDPQADRAAIADAVARYIRESASYTLTPEAMPDGEDFVLYFLQTLQEGYCIHFTTAAVLLLRSLDIPARFVGGYVATVAQSDVGSTVVLTDRNAHAWVEVFYEDVGWLYLEVTPSSGTSIIPEMRQHSPQIDSSEAQTPTPPAESDLPPIPPDTEVQNNTDRPQAEQSGGTDRLNTSAHGIGAWLFNIGIIAMCIITGLAAVILFSRLKRKHRQMQFKQNDTNAAVIYMWRYIQSLCGNESSPPQTIEGLALKARFSRHRITETERTEMIEFAKALASKTYKNKSKPTRIWFKHVQGKI